jgi:hypothetical protein
MFVILHCEIPPDEDYELEYKTWWDVEDDRQYPHRVTKSYWSNCNIKERCI